MNKITLIGNLGKDPELKQSSNGEYMTFSIAVKMKKDDTQWFSCQVWPDRMPALKRFRQWIKKGSLILVEGKLDKPKVYQSNSGEQGVNLSVSVSDINFVPGNKKDDTNQRHDNHDTQSIQHGQGHGSFEEDPDLPF